LNIGQPRPKTEQSSKGVARRGILLKPLGALVVENMPAIGQRESRIEGW